MANLTAAFSLDGETTTRIPPAFFSAIGRQAFIDLMTRRNGITTSSETQRIWRLLQRHDPLPKGVRVIVKVSEVMNLYPPGQPGTGSIASALDALWRDLIEN